jgi:hypothetical protein
MKIELNETEAFRLKEMMLTIVEESEEALKQVNTGYISRVLRYVSRNAWGFYDKIKTAEEEARNDN